MIKSLLRTMSPPILWSALGAIKKATARPLKAEGLQNIQRLGLRWRLDMSSGISRAMVEKGAWEPETTELIVDFVKPGMQVLAIGANFGYYALLMAKLVGPGGHVWAFEPTAKFREQLEWHVHANGFTDRITVVPFGLSDSEQQVTIEVMSQSASMHFPPYHPRIGQEVVELRPLDEVKKELGIGKVDFIQMDIDGHEAAFFRGAKQTLGDQLPPIAMEFAQACLHVAGSDVREVAELLTDLGYQICAEKTRKPYENEFEFLRECGNCDHHANALAVRKRTR
jgi:FkbM family methyltransferase